MNDIEIGSLAGLIATAPMTLAMDQCHEELPWWQRFPCATGGRRKCGWMIA